MTSDNTVIYNLTLNSFTKTPINKSIKNSIKEKKKESWEHLALILSCFGVQSAGKKYFIQWHKADQLQMAFLLKLLSKLIQGNILSTYSIQEKKWTLLLR
ncbi:MAG: hypothetical protein ACW981_16435 [Candidatus Hodarchaeales archaeon]|jgi:hypothetical protein